MGKLLGNSVYHCHSHFCTIFAVINNVNGDRSIWVHVFSINLCSMINMEWSFFKPLPSAHTWLTLPRLRLLLYKAQERKNLWKSSKPCLVGTHWKALAECSQMSTHLPGFQWFSRIFASFVLDKLATSSIRVNSENCSALSLESNTLTHVTVLLTNEWKAGKSADKDSFQAMVQRWSGLV